MLAARGGADPAKVREALRGGFAESRILELHAQRMIERDFATRGRCVTQLAYEHLHLPSPVQPAGTQLSF